MERTKLRAIAVRLALLAAVGLLTTCGGGGGGSTDGGADTPPVGPPTSQAYVVFAWNDLGMHCLNPTYDHAVILPPYNNVWAQVIKRGNPPQVVTSGLSVGYRILDNTYSYGKVSPGRWNFSQFWDNMSGLFSTTRPRDKGLNLVDPAIQNGLSGAMVAKSDHFQVNGIPVTPINDSDLLNENPYQVAEISVRDASGALVALTRTTVPTSFEINCGLCHSSTSSNPLLDVINKHNAGGTGVTLSTSAPVLCASCHPSPALNSAGSGSPLPKYLSEAVHGFHASKTTPAGAPITCYNCHPGAAAKCNRSLRHTATDGNCTTCHGTMAEVASSITSGSRVPWVSEKSNCATCHDVAAGSPIPEVDTGSTLYRNATGHGGISCPACHGSPHAMVPSSQNSDNYQVEQYQGSLPNASTADKSLGSCGVCHSSSKGANGASTTVNDWAGEHRSETASACNVCHTGFTNPTDATKWPHHFQWQAR